MSSRRQPLGATPCQCTRARRDGRSAHGQVVRPARLSGLHHGNGGGTPDRA